MCEDQAHSPPRETKIQQSLAVGNFQSCRQEAQFVIQGNKDQILIQDECGDGHVVVDSNVASDSKSEPVLAHVLQARRFFDIVFFTGKYNFQQARVRVPSGLTINAWREYLRDYEDRQIVDFLEFGWPVSFDRACPLISTEEPHKSGHDFPESVHHYVTTNWVLER